jgi:integrase/recombinase XerD
MTLLAADIAPVEYAVAVDRFLAEAEPELSAASRRVYRISLAGWAWPLVGRMPPAGRGRRGASPPVVPLALLDDAAAARRLSSAVVHRVQHAQPRTVHRELSALRSAVGWWQRRQWISGDPTAALRTAAAPLPVLLRPLTHAQLTELWATPAGLREQTFWHLLADCGAAADTVLALDADAIDLAGGRTRPAGRIRWGPQTGELLGWLLAGRHHGPVFLTDRRAPAGACPADVCPLTGRGRLSYRRSAEIFTEHTRLLDPAGRGWLLHQLRRAGASDQIPEPAAISNAV